MTSNKLNTSYSDREILGRNIPIFWFENVSSTMDKAKEIINEFERKGIDKKFFAVSCQNQQNGRGTRGRDWVSSFNNLYLTIVIEMDSIPIPLTLVPLRIGSIIAKSIKKFLPSDKVVHLKWPNDILIEGKKLCGVLIEAENNRLLIGIGCNVLSAPNLDPNLKVRPATCIADHSLEFRNIKNSILTNLNKKDSCETDTVISDLMNDQSNFFINFGDKHKELGVEISHAIKDWIELGDDHKSKVISDFEKNMDYSEQQLRDIEDEKTNKIVPIGLNEDGTLNVKFIHNNEIRNLIADYLW